MFSVCLAEFAPTLLALLLYSGHLVRRMYESWIVSIFSQRQVLGVVELLRVYSFYIAAGLSLIAEGPPLMELQCESTCQSLAS